MAKTLNKTSNKHIASGHRIGIVGGGQLAKMTALPAIALGCQIIILERTENTPSSSLARRNFIWRLGRSRQSAQSGRQSRRRVSGK